MTARFRALNLIMAIVMATGLVFQASPQTQAQAAPSSASLAAFTTGNIVVYRVGDGSTALVNTGNPVFLDEFTPSGTLIQTVAMPTTVNGSNKAFFAGGTSTSEGLLTRSTDGNYLLATGYAIITGNPLSGTTGATINRVVGRIDGSGNIDTTTALTDFASSNSPRAASSTNGTDLWIAGGAGGVRYTTLGTVGTSTQLSTSVVNMRQVNIFNGQLYGSDMSGSYRISTVGTGLPTTSGQVFTNLPGFPTSTGSPYAFFFADLDVGVSGVDTLYVADDTSLTGGIYKYSLVSGSWTANGVADADSNNYRGVTGVVSGTTVTLFATRKGGNGATGGGELVSLVDASGYNGTITATPTLLATAATNTAFRGVALAPNPPDIAPTVSSTVPVNTAFDVTLDATLTVNFSEPVTASGTWATLSCGGLPVAVTLGGSGSSYTIDPDTDLSYGASCTATVVAAQVTDLDGTPDLMAADYVWGFSTIADLAPTVIQTDPADSANGVAIDAPLTVYFSELVTATGTWGTLTCDSLPVAVTLGGSDSIYTIDPDASLPTAASCTATVLAAQVTDLDGTADHMAADYSWSFTTAAADLAPTVVSTIPTTDATGVAYNSDVTIVFSEAVTLSDGFATISCANSGAHTYATVTVANPTIVLNPDSDFGDNELCTVSVDETKVVDQDLTPTYMAAPYSWSYMTYDDPSPSVSSVSPINSYTGTEVTQNLVANFSEAVTVADGAVTLSCTTTGSHTVVVTPDTLTPATSFTINPDVDFSRDETCTATLESTLITDSIGQQLVGGDYTWSFKTVTPIGVARAAGNGWTGTIEGNVTVVPNTIGTRSFAIQDDTGGLYIYPSTTPPTMALGDVMKVTGTMTLYNSYLLQLGTITSMTWIGSGTEPAPTYTTTGSVGDTQGLLVWVEGSVTMPATIPEPGALNFSFSINDGSGLVTVYVYKTRNLDLTDFVTGQYMKLVGHSYVYAGTSSHTVEIIPRIQADIMAVPPEVTGTVPLDGVTGVSPYLPISATFNNPMTPGSFTGNFTLDGPSGAVSGTIGYDADTHTATFTPDAHLEGNASYTADLTTGIIDSFGIPLSPAYSWSFTTGELDSTAPVITDRYPAVDAVDVPLNTNVTVTFDDLLSPASINLAHFALTGPYGPVNASVTFDTVTRTVTFNPTLNLLPSATYTMTVSGATENIAGIAMGADETWSFNTGLEPTMHVYFGDLHNHTSYSDGSGTPSLALATGKAAGFDFMAITDHSYAIDDTEWANTLVAVNAATDANFVALRGFEYTQGAEGHINVYNTIRHAVRSNTGCAYCDYTPNLEAGVTVAGFYNWMASTGTVGLNGESTLMQFNHPGWINFNDWYFHPEINALPLLEEVGNGSGSSYVFSEAEFIRSLDYGWKVGATNNADTHSTYWGTNTTDRTGVVMAGLTKVDLLEALRARRTFATEDKNASVTMKANGYWMGSEIANTGSIHFVVNGSDTNGEQASKVELITDQGVVAALYVPISSTYTWEPIVPITTGVHYFYVKATQADGDRIVSSPVWTTGIEDIAITDLTIQPTLPTTHNASLLTVRVTNRVADSRTVHVTLSVNGLPQGSAEEVTVAGNADGYAIFNWQPIATGIATITAEITDAPAGDNPDDNNSSLVLNVSDEWLPLILIDASHANENATGAEMKPFMDDLADHGYNVLKNLDALTVEDLDPAVVKLLIITAPQTEYTSDEMTAIGNYVAAGGNLWLLGLADYTSSGANPWATLVAGRENTILAAIETTTGQNINMRMNDDEVIDANNNNGYIFGVSWRDFPSTALTGIGLNVETISTWSMNSIVDRNYTELTAADTDVMIIMQGDMDEGYTSDSYHDPFHTANEDASPSDHDGFIYNPTWVYPATKPAGAIPVPGAAAVQLTSGAGRIMLYGDSNDPFTIFSYTAGDGKQNELFNLQSVMWLLGNQLQKSTIAEARAQAVEDQPNNLGKLVWVEGEITAAYGEFFNVLYVQDATGGITVHAPAGDIDPSAFTRGTHVRAVGTIDIYEGDTEIEFFEAEMVQVITGDGYNATPLSLTTTQASLEENQGWLTVVSGTVLSKTGTDTLIVDDGSGQVRVFLDGYNGSLEDIHVMDQIQVTGLISEDGSGTRIRVRNHNFHLGVPDDVVLLSLAKVYYFPFVSKNP